MLSFYWVGSKNSGNFGDVLTPHLLDYYNIKYIFQKDRFASYNAICIGSIMRHAKPNTLVLGSGFMSRKNPVCTTADIRFIRGPESRKLILEKGGKCPAIYGDPAMLLPLFCDESKKQYDVGIVPHIDHYEQVKETYPQYHVINLRTDNALNVAKEITKCRSIISSSLHGIIAAHAYNIPAAWVNFGIMKGDGIKFEDHYLSLGLDPVQSDMENPIFTTGVFNTTQIDDIFKSVK